MAGIAEAGPGPARTAADLSVVGLRTVPRVLRDGVESHPERELLVFDPLDGGDVRSYTWREVLHRSLAVAELMAAAGVGAGDTVHVHLANRPEFIFSWFAAAELGARIVPTNTAATAAELAYILRHAEVGVSVTEDATRAAVLDARARAGVEGAVLRCEHELAAIDEVEVSPGPERASASAEEQLAVMYTSGTTSKPKGVIVTHANYVFAGETVAAGLRLGPGDRFLTVLPLFHANAQYYSTMGTLVSGGTLVLTSRFTASRYAELAARHRATVGSLFAAPIRMILAQEPRADWREHGLRLVAFAQNLTDAEAARWDEVIGAPLLQLYGMTETIGPPLMNPVAGRRRHDAIGRPVLGYTCRIVRADGSPAAPGEPGELLVNGVPGVSLMAGYLKDPAATAATLASGWLSTGDLVQLDDDGLVSFVGRTRDMIKRAGENVAAGEVEEVLLGHEAVLDAAVVGVPDAMRDEQIVGFVVLAAGAEAGEEELLEWCAERLAKFRVPSSISVETELPRTAVGKIQKHLLRDVWADRGEALPDAGG